jgi:hypothetical protein
MRHTDDFDIWKWSKQALGIPGHLLGWTGYMQKKINENATLSKVSKYYYMILQTLKTIFKRDLNRLKQEIELYQNESQIWTVQKE